MSPADDSIGGLSLVGMETRTPHQFFCLLGMESVTHNVAVLTRVRVGDWARLIGMFAPPMQMVSSRIWQMESFTMKIQNCLPLVAALGCAVIAGCQSSDSTAGSETTTPLAQQGSAGSRSTEAATLSADVDAALAKLEHQTPQSAQLVRRAKGVLVFPNVYKAGFVVGGDYGKGELRVNGRTVGYYSTAAASFGLQVGAESRSLVFLFMTDKALADFENSGGWSVGGNAAVTLVNIGANGEIDSSTLNRPVLAFVYGNAGLMGDLSLEGTKVSKIRI
jgi:lipid-binding SYLF domain-containing protein